MKMVFQANNFPIPSLTPSHKCSLEEFNNAVSALFRDRLCSVILYGSHARGDALPDSDIDILVVLDSSENLSHDWDQCIDRAADLASRTGVLISVMVCLAKDFAEREHTLLMNIRREGVAVA